MLWLNGNQPMNAWRACPDPGTPLSLPLISRLEERSLSYPGQGLPLYPGDDHRRTSPPLGPGPTGRSLAPPAGRHGDGSGAAPAVLPPGSPQPPRLAPSLPPPLLQSAQLPACWGWALPALRGHPGQQARPGRCQVPSPVEPQLCIPTPTVSALTLAFR